MLKIVIIALALTAGIVAQATWTSPQWTDVCVDGGCIVGP